MLLSDPNATPFDLRFNLFRTYVRVHPFFWLMCAILGWDFTRMRILSDNGMTELALWTLACFLSILLHEFGHVWMGRLFGSDGHIVLHSLGGLAIGSNDLRHGWQRILVSAAGPGIQLLLYGGLLALLYAGYGPERGTALWFLVFILLIINLYWPLLNLLPVWPLDGGMITRELCLYFSRRNGLLISLYISLTVSAVLAVNALLGMQGRSLIPYAPTSMWMGILFAMWAVGSWQGIQAERAERQASAGFDDRLPWER